MNWPAFPVRLRAFCWSVAYFAATQVGCVPDSGKYHTYEELDEDLHEMANQYPAIARISSIGKSVEGRDIWALKISGAIEPDGSEARVVFVGGHHGREWISVEVPFLIAEHLLQSYHSDSTIRELVDATEIWFVPLLNPDGHQYSVTTNRVWRKNRRDNGDGTFGVDLNRNYSHEWGGVGSSAQTYTSTYRGPEPFSEPETRSLRDFVRVTSPKAVVSYHNYSQIILYPWSYTPDPAPHDTPLSQLAFEMSQTISSVHNEIYLSEQGNVSHPISGGMMDWVYAEQSIPAFDIELRTEQEPPGFLLPASEIQETFEENLAGALHLVKWVLNQYPTEWQED